MFHSFGEFEKLRNIFSYNCLIVKYVLLFTLQIKYTQDHKQMKGRPSLILDTPGLRCVKEAQNHISMVGYNQLLLLMTKTY